MAEVDVTATTQALHQQTLDDQLITDESLNAGSLLPSDAYPQVDDGRVMEVKIDPAKIEELLPKEDLSDIENVALESQYVELSYLREDIVNAQGMSQKFAAEAIAIKPNFGGKPLSYYSKLPSKTRLQASIEEIDQTMQESVVGQIDLLVAGLKGYQQRGDGAASVVSQIGSSQFSATPFAHRIESIASALDMFARSLGNTSQADKADVIHKLQGPKDDDVVGQRAHSLALKDAYYYAFVALPTILEYLTLHVKAWHANLDQFLAAKDGAKVGKIDVPEPAASVTFIAGKSVKADQAVETLQTLRAKAGTHNALTLLQLTRSLADNVVKIDLGSINSLLTGLNDELSELANTLSGLSVYLASADKHSDELTFINDAVHDVIKPLVELVHNARSIGSMTEVYILDFLYAIHYAADQAVETATDVAQALTVNPDLSQADLDPQQEVQGWLTQLTDDFALLCKELSF